MKITFYHWGFQCPIINETLKLLEYYEDKFQIDVIDISNEYSICKTQRIYFPFLTVFDQKQRWFRPLDSEILEKYLKGEPLLEKPSVKSWSKKIYAGEVQLLSVDNFKMLKDGCTLTNCVESCMKKGNFLKGTGVDSFGFIHLQNGKIVGGAEYLPSLCVPYDIPRGDSIAFLTCLYHSSEKFDYKSVPLERLEEQLCSKFRNLIAITDEIGSFPNGDLQWFIDKGYKDLGVISVEENYCKLHLVEKELRNNL